MASSDTVKAFIEETKQLQDRRKARHLCESRRHAGPCLGDIFVYTVTDIGYQGLCQTDAVLVRNEKLLEVDFVATEEEAIARLKERKAD
jgi:hypothetical protein